MRQHKSYRYSFLSFIFLLLFVVSNTFVAAGQTSIGDVINRYAKVVSVNAYSVQVATQEQAGLFSVGDTILLIQMKGVVMRTDGAIEGTPDGAIGLHEFLIISSISGRQINFSSPIVHYGNTFQPDNFNPEAFVQIIKVPSYNSAIVKETLSATSWNSSDGYGGVLAFFAGKSLELNADIDVTGKGFVGPDAVSAIGILIDNSEDDYDKYSYPADGDTSGFKGEGIGYLLNINGSNQPINPKYSKGKAPNYSGGGGGNGAFSGGGGGSNGGAGGMGGLEKDLNSSYLGGLGGNRVETPRTNLQFPNFRLYLGGGGGGSTYKSGEGSGVNAGNGGGIIIIVCDSIIGNGHRILANGVTPLGSATGNGGAGGGGAGGSIAIYTSVFANSNITISANGGNGGNGGVSNGRGSGGGGGGGIVALSGDISLNSISVEKGYFPYNDEYNDIFPEGNGYPGIIQNDFMPLLNGFLFNSIWSSSTFTRIDSVCQGSNAPTIGGTIPTGVGPFTYLWQTTTDISSRDYTSVNGGRNFYPGQRSDTTWIRRVVTDTGANPIVSDTSNWVMLIYHPPISGNVIQLTDNTICAGENVTINPSGGNLSGGNGIYSYQWQQQINGSWNNLGVTAPEITTGSLTQSTSFRRVVNSGSCESASSSVSVTVHPIPKANAGPDDSVCGMEYTLEADTTSGSGSWVFPSGVTGNNNNGKTTVYFNDFGDRDTIRYSFTWVVANSELSRCVDRDIVEITFYKEIGEVNAGEDMIVGSLDRVVTLNANPSNYEGTWSVVSGTGSFDNARLYNTSVTNFSENNTYQWTVTNGPCSASDIMNLDVLPIDVPEGLSPNGDGINDILDISGINFSIHDAELTILNGAGKKIYSTSNVNGAAWNGWEGRNDAGQEMPEGTYYYILKVSSKETEAKMTKSGFIVLKRK